VATIEGLKKKIDGTLDLQKVVKTMKAMAAVNIRQYENAVAALEQYHRAVQMGLRIALRNRPELSITARSAPRTGLLGAVVIGSDQGMCGQLNETVVTHAVERFGDRKPALAVVGLRALHRLEDEGFEAQHDYAVPGAVESIDDLVRRLLVDIESWYEQKKLNRIDLYNCRPRSRARYEPHRTPLLPLDRHRLNQIRQEPWPGRTLPVFTLDWEKLFSGLVRHYLHGSLFRAVAESLASENASRLAAMQGAESNIEEQLDRLRLRYQRKRQMSITEELLDIVSGFEALQ
jgi:F-type H+-transporting ATPase subunit gamma